MSKINKLHIFIVFLFYMPFIHIGAQELSIIPQPVSVKQITAKQGSCFTRKECI